MVVHLDPSPICSHYYLCFHLLLFSFEKKEFHTELYSGLYVSEAYKFYPVFLLGSTENLFVLTSECAWGRDRGRAGLPKGRELTQDRRNF